MPEVQIRPAKAADLSTLVTIDHSCESDYVWQMDMYHDEDQIGAVFREIRLPRSIKVPYPRSIKSLSDTWSNRLGVLIAVVDDQVVGYVRINDALIPRAAWLTDIVVNPRYRRQGIASALIFAVQAWAVQRNDHRVLLEMPSKNNPAIRLALKLGYEFCGYNDQYYETQDIVLFFGRSIR